MSHNNNQWNHNRNTRNSGGGQGGDSGGGGGGGGGNGPGGGNRNWNSGGGGRFNNGRERRPYRGGFGGGRNDGRGGRRGGNHFNQWNRNGGGGMGGPDGNYQRHPNQNNSWQQQQSKQLVKHPELEIPLALTVPPPMLLPQIAPSLIMDFDAPELEPPPGNGIVIQSAPVVALPGNNSPEGFRGFSEAEPAANGSEAGKHDDKMDLSSDGNELFKLIEDEALKMITEQPSCSGVATAQPATPLTSASAAVASSSSSSQSQERRATFERSADQVTRKLINQLTTMNKYNLKQMINNPDSKYESALKTHARQKLRAEVRRQLRNFNLSDGTSAQAKASICGMLEPDESVDSDKIPDALLEQIGKVLDLNLLHLDVNETDLPTTSVAPGGAAPVEEDAINASDVDPSAAEVLDKNLGLTDDEGTLQLDAEDIFARAELLLMKGSESTRQGNSSGPSSPTEEMFPNDQIESIVSEENGFDKVETIVIDSDDETPTAKPSAEPVLGENQIKNEPVEQEEVADKNPAEVAEEACPSEMEVAAEVQIEDIPVPSTEPDKVTVEVQVEQSKETPEPDKVTVEATVQPVQSQTSVDQDKDQTEDDEQQSDILELHDSQVELLEEVVEFDKDQIVVQQEEVVEHEEEEVVREDKEDSVKEQSRNEFEDSDEIVLSKRSDFEEPDEEDEERNKFAAPLKHKVKEKKSAPDSPDKIEETTGCLSDAMACVFPCLLRVNTVEELNKKASNLPVVARVRSSDDDEPPAPLREKRFEEPPKKPLKKPIIDITDLKIPDVDFSVDPNDPPASETPLETPSDIIRVPSFTELTVRRSKNPRTYKPNLVHHEQPKRDNKSTSASPTHSTSSTTSSKSHDTTTLDYHPLRAKLGLLLNPSTSSNNTQRASRKSEHALRASRSCGNLGAPRSENGNDGGSSPQIDLPEASAAKEVRKPRSQTPGPKHAAEQLSERKKKKHSKRRPYSPSDEVDPDLLRKTPSPTPVSSREPSPSKNAEADAESASVPSRSARAKSVDPKLFCPEKKEKKLKVKQRSKSRSGRDPDEIRREKIKEEIRQLEKEILEERERDLAKQRELTQQQERELLLEKEMEIEQALARERALAIEKERELELAKKRAAIEKERELELAKKRAAIEKERALAIEKERALAIEKERALAIEKERALAIEKERVLAMEKERALAIEKERTLAIEKERALAIEKERALAIEKERALELAKERDRQRQLEAAREKERRAAELALAKEREKQLAKERAKKGKEIEDSPEATETTPVQTKEQSSRERKRRQSSKSVSKVVEESPKRSKSATEIPKESPAKEVSKKDGKKEADSNVEVRKKDGKSVSKTKETNGVVADKSAKEVGKDKDSKESPKKEKHSKEISKEPESSPEKPEETVEEHVEKPRKRKKSLLRGPDLVKGRKEVEMPPAAPEDAPQPEPTEAVEDALDSCSEISVTDSSSNQVLTASISRAERSLTHRTASPRPWKSPGEKKQLPVTPLATTAPPAAAPATTVTTVPSPVEQPTVSMAAATASTVPVYSSLASLVTDAVRNNPTQTDVLARLSIPSSLVPESSLFAPVMGLLNQMQEIDNKMSDFQRRKMQIDSEMLKLNSEKFQIDQLSMQLQNERFMVLNAMRAAILECELTSLATAQSARRRHLETDPSSGPRSKRRKSMPAPANVETSPRTPRVETSHPDLSEAESDVPPAQAASSASGGERTIRKITKISGNTQILKLFQRRRLISEKSAEEDQSDADVVVTAPTPEQPTTTTTSKRRRTRTINVTTSTEQTAEPSPAVTTVPEQPTPVVSSGRHRQQRDSIQSESSESISAVQPAAAAEQPLPAPSVTSAEVSAPASKTSPPVPVAQPAVTAVATTTTTTTPAASAAPPSGKKSRRENPPPRSVLTREVKIVLNKLNVKKRS